MILIFLGSPRATAAVFLSIPLSVMVTFFVLHPVGRTINSMVLSGLALAFSRLIDNSVVVLENIFRHLELGEDPAVAAEQGANEVALAVLAITLVTVVVFFPVTLLFGVSKYPVHRAGAGRGDLALFASYFVAVSVVPLYLRASSSSAASRTTRKDRKHASNPGERDFTRRSTPIRADARNVYDRGCRKALDRPSEVVVGFLAIFVLSFALYPFVGVSFFPRTDAGPIRHQREGAHRNAPRSDRRLRQAEWKTSSGRWFARTI